MPNVVDLIMNDANASDISDKIKEILYTKAAENIEELVPEVSASLFGDADDAIEDED
jgi:hypothetical protein